MKKLKYLPVILMLFPLYLQGQANDIIATGKVVSAFGEELIGVQVHEIDKNNRAVSAASTDYTGNFSLQIKNTANKLRFIYIGFVTKDVAIGDAHKFDIVLEESNTLSEVVVSARAMHSDGTLSIPQREISGAVQKLSIEKFTGISAPSIDDLLQGQIAGLDIIGNSGNLGAGSTLRVRGTTSINSNSEPLIVVNDVPYENNIPSSFDFSNLNQEQFANLLNINPDDIEEITVLKDGASAAIWGSRGANGVIAIRTKKGAKGPTRV
ncbi:MAG: TonB-dependent receptor plug domain-containing protein, partial [Tannerella sp.]|nr:TonB-dependent receptor plug domain-containing protein [Tannerella sp.]